MLSRDVAKVKRLEGQAAGMLSGGCLGLLLLRGPGEVVWLVGISAPTLISSTSTPITNRQQKT